MQLEVLALDENAHPIHISEVPVSQRGKRCTAVCASCGERLWAKLGSIRAWHFAHPAGQGCGQGTETALHVAAKDILQRMLTLATPPVSVTVDQTTEDWLPSLKMTFASAIVEHRLDGLTPDVVLKRHDKPDFLVEIRVTHPCPPEKIKRVSAGGLPCLEVDVRHVRLDSQTFDRGALERLLTEDGSPEHKTWIFVPGLAERQRELCDRLEEQARRAAEAAQRQREAERRRRDEKAKRAEAERLKKTAVESQWEEKYPLHPLWLRNRGILGLAGSRTPRLLFVLDIPGTQHLGVSPTVWQSQVWMAIRSAGVQTDILTSDVTASIQGQLPELPISDDAVGSYFNRLAKHGIVKAIPPHYGNDPASWVWRVLRLPNSSD